MPLRNRTDMKRTETERLQAMVVDLLREEENKYCADCEAKQPRWASWNLGVFLCIRCAGIHRNLGVHLTKVKSVNLDSWTAEQVQSMRVMGNKMARHVYEAELPEHFRRPQTDSALESFIRAKYEQKRYILKDWSPPPVNASDLPLHDKKNFDRSSRSSVKELELKKTGNVIKNSNISKAVGHPKIERLADIPLLDLSTPSLKVGSNFCVHSFNFGLQQKIFSEVDTNVAANLEMSINVGMNDSDGMEDFGPIVSAPPASSKSNTFVADATATSSSGKSGFVSYNSENHLEDLVSMLGTNPVLPEKKSTSDILALYAALPNFHLPSTKHTHQFPEPVVSNAGLFVSPSVVSQTPSSYVSESSHAPSNAFGSSFTSSNGKLFPNRETAAIFAAASPFVSNSSVTPNIPSSNTAELASKSPESNASSFFHLLQQREIRTKLYVTSRHNASNPILNNFLADFSRLGMKSESTDQSSGQENISWN
ncbi:unnamed protein product [Thelazia callipaeda]|uniref:Arf-GAP domain-containing protein n=1 Tax=Thelazia callipaeda TaxID=103827 RepID=A0A0N5D9S7_THECL|nr:unnamed protein product [Thelazia callipaeda]